MARSGDAGLARSRHRPPWPRRRPSAGDAGDEPLDLRVVIGVLSASLLTFTGIGATLPVLPRYVSGPLGGDAVTVGIVMGCYTVTGLLARPFAGRASDRRGRRKIVVAGLAALVLSGALLLLATGVVGVIVAQLVLGLGRGSMNTTFNLWMIDAAPERRRAQAVGLFGLAIWAGLAFGPLIGDALLHHVSYEAVWWFAALTPLAACLIVRWVPEERVPVPELTDTSLLPRVVLSPGMALLLTNVGWGTAAAFIVLHLGERGVGGAAAVYTAYGVAIVAVRLLAGRLPDIVGPGRTVVVGGLAESAGLALLARASSTPVAVVGGLALGVGTSLIYPALALLVLERTSPEGRGAAFGAFTSFFDVGVGIGAPLAGVVAGLAGYEAAFWMAATCAMLGTLWGAVSARRAPPADPG